MNDMLSTAFGKLQSIPFRERPGLTAIATSSVLLFPFAIRNYLAFLRLKPAAPIANPLGWLFSLTLRLFARESKSIEEYEGPHEEKGTWLGDNFAWRKGDRPEISWFVGPHRQMTQWSAPDMHKKIQALIDVVAAENPNILEIRTSEHELRSDALFVARRIVASPPNQTCRSAYGEVAHVHDTFDYSLHVVLSPQDCKKVIQRGWGERHPCSGRLRGLPKEYLLIYVPRDDEELGVVREIIRAAAGFMAGEQLV